MDFVARITRERGSDFVPPAERMATFDNGGSLWTQHPMYIQMAFALDRAKALAPQHPEWRDQQAFKAVLEGDLKALAASGEKGLVELLAYLRANGFKTYIVSGGGIEFMRPWTEKAYGIAPEQVICSSIKTKFEMRDGKPVLMRLPEIDFIDDKDGKPVGIGKCIGRRPILAFGNSDGDQQMLQWTAAGSGARFMGLVHHTDAEREWAYDRQSHVGRLDKALDEGTTRGWTIVDMKRDWRKVFP